MKRMSPRRTKTRPVSQAKQVIPSLDIRARPVTPNRVVRRPAIRSRPNPSHESLNLPSRLNLVLAKSQASRLRKLAHKRVARQLK